MQILMERGTRGMDHVLENRMQWRRAKQLQPKTLGWESGVFGRAGEDEIQGRDTGTEEESGKPRKEQMGPGSRESEGSWYDRVIWEEWSHCGEGELRV